jgi:hypothetical protein
MCIVKLILINNRDDLFYFRCDHFRRRKLMFIIIFSIIGILIITIPTTIITTRTIDVTTIMPSTKGIVQSKIKWKQNNSL